MNKNFDFLIVAPFWKEVNHVGVFRIEKFVRWLSKKGFSTALLYAGKESKFKATEWGLEICLKDQLGIYKGDRDSPYDETAKKERKPNRLRRWVAETFFIPDTTITWALQTIFSNVIKNNIASVKYVLSSSPPEGAHISSYILSKHYGAKLLIDMRDGWVDEPLRQVVISSWLRKKIEKKIEKKILESASRIYVTSEVWLESLNKRLFFTKEKTVLLTNGYDKNHNNWFNNSEINVEGSNNNKKPLELLYTGKLTLSDSRRRFSKLIKRFNEFENQEGVFIKIIVIGKMSVEDKEEIESARNRLVIKGIEIITMSSKPRKEIYKMISLSDGLLLLSTSFAAIPIKFFEYISSRKPVYCVAPKDSAVWRVASELPQFFVDTHDSKEKSDIVNEFIDSVKAKRHQSSVPKEYEDEYLKEIFLKSFCEFQ